jgi:ATP-dependent DNA helicase RecQ
MTNNAQGLLEYLTSSELRKIRASQVAALDSNPHEVCVYYIAHLHNLIKIAASGGILPYASVQTKEGDLAGQQVQRLRDSVELKLGPSITKGRRPIRRPLHSCVNFFWNPNNITNWVFQVRALHQAAEQDDPAFGCLCIIEIPLSFFTSSPELYWCSSDINLAARDPRHTHRIDQLTGAEALWPWRQIFANRDRLYNAAEFVVFRAEGGNKRVSAPVPVSAVSRVLVPYSEYATAKRALAGTVFEPVLKELYNSAIFPGPSKCLHEECLFARELATLSRFGISSAWLRETLSTFSQCDSIIGRHLRSSSFTDESLAYSKHGIGHVTRFLFWIVFLARWSRYGERTERNVVIAAFLHCLARENQHGDSCRGSDASSSEFASAIFTELNIDSHDQQVIREAIKLHYVAPEGETGHGNIVADVLRCADNLEHGRFDKPLSSNGCDPRRLNLPIFEDHAGAAGALASIAQRIALFTRHENWHGNTFEQLVRRIKSALGSCLHHELLHGVVKATAVSLLDPSVTEPEPLPHIETPLSGAMIPRYSYAEPLPPSESEAWLQHGGMLVNYTVAATVSCEWEESPVASVLENIITRGTPCPSSRYVTDAAKVISKEKRDSASDLEFTTQIHQIQRALTHLMAGQALPVDSPKWRIAISGPPSITAYMAIVDFYRLLRAVRALQSPPVSTPTIELLLALDEESTDFADEVEVRVHTSPVGRYEAHIELRSQYSSSTQAWSQTPKYVHNVVVMPDPKRLGILQAPLRNSSAIDYSVDTENKVHTDALVYLLRNLFWKEDFRPGQLDVITRALKREDVIALLPTGAGKSLTYQLPALLQPGLTIVVDPLKSLMRDQDKSLKAYGIDRSVFINSSLNSGQIGNTLDQVSQGMHQFIFVSPERLQIRKFRNMLRSMEGQTFAYCVVDEAHCVSEWGHDFRTSYLRLGDTARRYCPSPDGHLPLIALTGTASYDVLSDVQKELDISDPEALVRPHTYERKELHFDIIQTGPPAAGLPYKMWQRCSDVKRTELLDVLESIPSQVMVNGSKRFEQMMKPDVKAPSAGLVFCPHKTGPFGARPLADYLKETYPALAGAIGTYHGASDESDGMDDAVLQKVQVDFMSGRKSILACTKAFGMGIDKPNIRFTIHFAMPQSIEAFYQEAGRAGRDRQKAYCGLIYTDTDTGRSGPMDQSLLMSFHNNSFPGWERDARGLAELLLGSKYFRFYDDKWLGLEKVFQNMRPRGSCVVSIPFNNFGVTAIAKAVHEVVKCHASDSQVRKALSFCGTADEFIKKLASEVGFRNGFPPELKTELEPMYNSTRLAPETFRAVYRLLVLGLIEDYEIDYGAKKIHATLVRLEDAAIKTNLVNYLTRYIGRHDRRVQLETIDARRGETVLQKCCGHLLDFVYDEIAAKRKSAMQNMENAVHGGLEYGIDEFTRRVNTYFDSRFTTNILDDLREKPAEKIVETYIKESKGRPDDVEHLWGSCDRLVESYPTHAGLFLLRAFTRWSTNRSLDNASRDARKGYEILLNDNNWQPAQLAAFQARYIKWIGSVNPDAANLAKSEIIGRHIEMLSNYETHTLGGN